MPANTSGCSWASSTVAGSSGQPGVSGAKPASSNASAHRSQLLGSSHRPWMNTTGRRPDAFARSTCRPSCSVTVAMSPPSLVVPEPGSVDEAGKLTRWGFTACEP